MRESIKISKEEKWRSMWYKYAEFLRAYGHTPDLHDPMERDLYRWFTYNNTRLSNLDEQFSKSFVKLQKGGDIYDFYVTNRDHSLTLLKEVGNVADKQGSDVSLNFVDICKLYNDFCIRMERHPWAKKSEEEPLATWFFNTRADFFNNKLPDTEMKAFDKLLQSVSSYTNYNINANVARKPNIGLRNKIAKGENKLLPSMLQQGLANKQDARWFKMCDKYIKYLEDNQRMPTQGEDMQLYHWMYRQERLFKKGEMPDKRKDEFGELLKRLEGIREPLSEKQREGARTKLLTHEEKKASSRKSTALRRKSTNYVKLIAAKSKGQEHTSQDDLWNAKWQAYMNYMAKYQHRPSKHKAKDMVLFDWFKHSKKLLNQGKMRGDRVEKFRQLLEEAMNLQRINNYRYSNGEKFTGLPVESKVVSDNDTNAGQVEQDTAVAKVHNRRKKRSDGIKLYDYQEEMLQRVESEFWQHRSLMVQMPTGTGKTYLLVAVVSDFIRETGGQVWIVTHRRELVQQVKSTIRKFKTFVDDAENIEEHATVYSIQWLTRHYDEVKEKPGLIIIDEAHHAVAKTYSSVINAFPQSKILGLTATPCRLNGQPFTDLFEELLQSWTIGEFIAKKYLSLYDYMSVRPSSADVKIINGLNRRGVDGDFSVREMAEKLDIRPSLQRLCDTVLRYAKGKKGIVYAISIQHAEHIAEFYRENGIKAEAVSNKTPTRKRNDILQRFKDTPTDGSRPLRDDDIQVIVNVQLFDEGWDVPDAEFIQLARPTLSLSKYLQMVGRGLRVYGGKKFCIILDNVGSYRLFGLPSDERDWERMFEGKLAGKGMIDENSLSDQFEDIEDDAQDLSDDRDTDMMMLLDHRGLSGDLKENFGYKIVKDRYGLYGIVDKDGNNAIPCEHGKITLRPNAIAQLFDEDGSESDYSWIDLISGIRFRLEPSVIRKDSIELTTRDNFKFYPRVKSRWMNQETYTLKDILDCGTDDGLRFRNFYIQPSEPRKLYKYIERIDDKTLYKDEDENLFLRTDYEQPLKKTTKEEWDRNKETRRKELVSAGLRNGGDWGRWDDYRKNDGKDVKIGFLEFTEKDGAYQYNYDPTITFRRDRFTVPHLIRRQIRMRDDICFLGDNYIVTKARPHVLYHIYQRYVDGRRFDVEFYAYPSMRYYCRRLYYDGKNPPVVGNTDIKDAQTVEWERYERWNEDWDS